ncbi:MAG: aspartate--ammonia ligase [Chloroflexota bacterium]|nr:aspartate--ammonia ligase [Chloroflexota bacterium]MBI5704690.1 aspartate--ammonia ligase [Chloroflexota bacterium]
MSTLIIPPGYRSALDVKQTEKAIKLVKDFFETNLAAELRLTRVTAPLFVLRGTGINDDLNGVEAPVAFPVPDMGGHTAEVVQSLAKWKRMMLADYGIPYGYGLYTDMNAIRPSEALDNIHSLYVDQWDWERVISEQERSLDFLKTIVRKIYSVMKRTEFHVWDHYPFLEPELPEDITFIHSEDLQREYPHLTPREREDEIVRKYKAVFIIGIGSALADGKPHDGRAPDYDDWTTPTLNGYKGLNGDIIIWNSVLGRAYEISSMGIRVDREALLRQLELTGAQERKELLFHRRLLNGELPLSIGGGIGQSRLCMYYLRKAHIGEIQVSLWPPDMVEKCKASNIFLL